MRKLSLIFPMAGQGARFGYRFKPFLDVDGQSFIEAAVAPFRSFVGEIGRIHFIVTAEQNRVHDVRTRLARMFEGLPFDVTLLAAPTEGPAETLLACLDAHETDGPILVCDCDHAVEVEGLIAATRRNDLAGAMPTWSLDGESLNSWGVAAVRGDGRIEAIAEKRRPDRGEKFRGVIGCYYFADGGAVRRAIRERHLIYLSDVVAEWLVQGLPVLSVPVTHGRFFGDPARLARVAAAAE